MRQSVNLRVTTVICYRLNPECSQFNYIIPVELVESQFDLGSVSFSVATPVTEDLLDAADAERLGSIQV